MKKNYSTVDPKGADLKCTMEDLPLFWRSRISEVTVAENPENELLTKRRNEATLRSAWVEMNFPPRRTQLPISALGTSLRLPDISDTPKRSRELGQLKRFAAFYRASKVTSPKWVRRRSRNIGKLLLSKLPIGNKIMGYIHTFNR